MGAFFVVVGIGLEAPDNTAPPQSAINFTIGDNLGVEIGQVSEQVEVSINGRPVGTLTVNQNYPRATLTVTVPKPGQYTYSANARAVFDNGKEGSCAGQGNVDISDGKKFNLNANSGGNTCFIVLQEE
ncbi:MAG: hypothetical protein V7K41_27910 [Nostoc sp.]